LQLLQLLQRHRQRAGKSQVPSAPHLPVESQRPQSGLAFIALNVGNFGHLPPEMDD
jgi:hypothetical protein